MPFVSPHLLLALALALVFHGALVFFTFGRTYDAFVHIFFADHYARTWFDHWDYRWYTGFPMTSYPPGSQQSIALLSKFVGLRNGFIIVQTCASLMMVLGIYRFSRLWVSEEAAGYAALLTVFASSITETIHVFGQLPTTFSLGFLLNALPFVHRWLQRGELRILLLAWSLNAATTAGHHVTTLFGAVFFVAPVIGLGLVDQLRTSLPDEPTAHPAIITRRNLWPLVVRRLRRILPASVRAGVYGVGLVSILLLVVLPYWLWSKADPITQVSIPHASRDSFIVNTNAGLVFWLIPYGLSLIALPYVAYKGMTTRAWPLTLSIGVLFFLGTGGTTPYPKKLLGGAFDVLTLDRFTFWATICNLPLLGEFVVSLRHGGLARLIRGQLGRTAHAAIQTVLVAAYLLIAIFVVNLTQFRRFQPAAIEVGPIVTFLEKDEHWKWRYMTLGFGDQVAWMGAQTLATSVDGNYHSARRLPELTSTPIERLEGAKFRGIPGIGSLQQFLAVPEKYNLKFIFSNDQFYDPLLYFSGWHRLQRLENGIMVWERADIPALPEELPRKEIPVFQRVMWGLVPMGAIFTALIMLSSYAVRQALRAGGYLKKTGEAKTQPPAPTSRLWSLRVFALLIKTKVRRLVAVALRLALRPWRWLDARLLRWSALPPSDSSSAIPWQVWVKWLARLPRPRPIARPARAIRVATLGVILFAVVMQLTLSYQSATTSPEAVMQAYYDDLDFRRFVEAHARLDPKTRPAYEQYLLNLSLRGGLLASYGKLDSVIVRTLRNDGDRVTVEVQTVWITALNTYPSTRQHELVRRDGHWYITPDEPTVQHPTDLFVRRPTLDFYAPDTRADSGLGLPPAASDRPNIEVRSARLVQVDGRYSVVGELASRDPDPADATVTAVLYGAGSVELSRYNAQSAMIHKLLPGETTPFRVDFEGVAGALITDTTKVGDFKPGDFTPPQLAQPVEVFAVNGKAVVTGRDLVRTLAIQDLQTSVAADGTISVSGSLYNTGTAEATIPELLITCYDAAGQVLWVEQHFEEAGVLPLERRPFSVRVTAAAAVTTLLPEGYLSPAAVAGALTATAPERLALPAGAGYASLRLSVQSFTGAP